LFETKVDLIAWLDNTPTTEANNSTCKAQTRKPKTPLEAHSCNNRTSRIPETKTNKTYREQLTILEAKYEACLWWRTQPEYSAFSTFLKEKLQQSIVDLEKEIQTVEAKIIQNKEK
jgi:hypothetical protein